MSHISVVHKICNSHVSYMEAYYLYMSVVKLVSSMHTNEASEE